LCCSCGPLAGVFKRWMPEEDLTRVCRDDGGSIFIGICRVSRGRVNVWEEGAALLCLGLFLYGQAMLVWIIIGVSTFLRQPSSKNMSFKMTQACVWSDWKSTRATQMHHVRIPSFPLRVTETTNADRALLPREQRRS